MLHCLELLGSLSEGETEEEAWANVKDAILTIVDMM
jgi:predicted RNase H-like HicB family nuclease